MNDLLFDVPWWIPTLLAIFGISLFVNGNKRQVSNVRNAGIGVLLLGIGWVLLSYFVDTDKEKVEKGTKELMQYVVAGNWDKFQSQLTPTATFHVAGIAITGAANVAHTAQGGVETVKVTSAQVQHLRVEPTGTFILAHCDILSIQENYRPIENSSWQFDWEQTNEGWKCREIRLISLKDIKDEDLERVIPKAIFR